MRRALATLMLALGAFSVLGAVAPNIQTNLKPITWTMVGPGAGGAFNTAMETQEGVLLVGGDVGGLFRSLDHGQSWLPIGKLNASEGNYGLSTIFDRTNVSALAYDPRTDTSVVYVGIEGGLLRSRDGGRSFHARFCDTLSTNDWIASIAVSRGHPDTVYALWHSNYNDTTFGVLRISTNRGLMNGASNVWARTDAGAAGVPWPRGTRLLKVLCQPYASNIVYVLTGDDGMVDWSTKPHAPGKLLGQYRLWRSRDAGATWTNVSPDTGLAADSTWDFVIEPNTPDTLIATTWTGSRSAETHTGRTWRSTNEGNTWTKVSDHGGAIHWLKSGAAQSMVAVVQDVVRDWNPSCTECGVWYAAAPYTNWIQVANGDETKWRTGWQFMSKWAYSKSERGVCNTVFGAADSVSSYWTTSEYCFRSDNDVQTFGNYDPMFCDFRKPGPQAGQDFWRGRAIGNTIPMASSAANGIVAVGWYDLGIGISRDGGLTWQMSNDSSRTAGAGGWLGHGGDCSTILIDPRHPATIWAAQGTGKTGQNMIRSVNYGAPSSWAATSGMSNGLLYSLALDPKSPIGARILFCTNNGDLWRSADDGASWTKIWDKAAAPADSGLICAGARGSTVLIGGAGGLYRSTNGGVDSSGFSKIFGPGANPAGGAGSGYRPCWTYSSAGSAYDFRFRGVHDIECGPSPSEWFCTIAATSSGSATYLLTNGSSDSAGVFRSTDDGVTWSRVSMGLGYADRFHRSADDAWWVSSRSVGAGGGLTNGEGFFRSLDHGRTWQQMSANLPWPSVSAITSDPDEASWILVNALGPGVWRADLPGLTGHHGTRAGPGLRGNRRVR